MSLVCDSNKGLAISLFMFNSKMFQNPLHVTRSRQLMGDCFVTLLVAGACHFVPFPSLPHVKGCSHPSQHPLVLD